jgi:hypothetical protein
VFLLAGLQRTRAVERALDSRSFAPVNATLLVVLAAAGLLLGLGVIALVLFG